MGALGDSIEDSLEDSLDDTVAEVASLAVLVPEDECVEVDRFAVLAVLVDVLEVVHFV